MVDKTLIRLGSQKEIPKAGEHGEGPKLQGSSTDPSVPSYRPVPNRWLVTRRIAPGYQPSNAKIPEYESWIVQSDAMRKLSTDKTLKSVDLEVDVSPFVDPNLVKEDGTLLRDVINSQGEIFVGKKIPLEEYDLRTANDEPAVDLHVMTSTNPLLADYQPHNPNIFSTLDNFAYKDGETVKYLESAQADYSIIGWHSKETADPLRDAAQPAKNEPDEDDAASPEKTSKSVEERLKACGMALKGFDVEKNKLEDPGKPKWWADAASFLADTDDMGTTICHSTMYGVNYGPKLPKTVEARQASPRDKDALFAVGTSELDALVAYFATEAAAMASDSEVARDLRRLMSLLGENGDGDIDGIQKYSDEAYKRSFRKVDSGTMWTWQAESKPGAAPKGPSSDEITALHELNQAQKMADNLAREENDLRWQIFAVWWTWISSTAVSEHKDHYKTQLTELVKRLAAIRSDVDKEKPNIKADLNDIVKGLVKDDLHTKSGAESYYQRRDPTLLFSKVGHGWEADFSDTVQVRRPEQTVTVDTKDADAVKASEQLKKLVTGDKVLPMAAQNGVKALLEEFRALSPKTADAQRSPTVTESQVMPHFADTDRDQWKETQPWRPLFVEWEMLYYEVPFEKWRCAEYPKANKYGASVVEYVVDEDISRIFDPEASGGQPSKNVLRIAGRNYLQPQAAATFKTLIGPVFDNTSADVLLKEFGVTKGDKQHMIDLVNGMEFVSAPLTALTSSLLTMRGGSHLTPLISRPQSTPVALPDATTLFEPICPEGVAALDVLQLIGGAGGATPYASSVPMTPDHYPLRPLQHGQFQFIKLNIVDKFGQAVHLVDPKPPRNGEFYTVCPIVSDSLAPRPVGPTPGPGNVGGGATARPNIPLRLPVKDANPFVSLPPAINQPCRINASFVKKVQQAESEGGGWAWRRCSDWENPVWGWVVVNYADSGIQFFLENGRFYREIRFGTQHGTSLSHKFLPFEPPRDERTGKIVTHKQAQLDFLIEKLSDPTYLLAFWDMINTSFDSASFQHAPTSYSNFTSAIIGKPLALVNAGWSLELANQPRRNWTTSDVLNPQLKPPRTLLKPEVAEPWAERQWPPPTAEEVLKKHVTETDKHGYAFPVKIGDASRRYDGLVAYFQPKEQLNGTNDDLDLSTIFTFPQFISPAHEPGPRTKISPETWPRHTPYWFAPQARGEAASRHDDKLRVLGMLIDPFLPVHAFSAILPTRSLKLPPWSLEQALKKMTAFWHAGPLVVAHDVEPFSLKRILNDDYIAALDDYAKGDKVPSPSPSVTPPEGEKDRPPLKDTLPTVQFPLASPTAAANGADAKFLYLQPYMVPVDDKSPQGATTTRYNPFRIDSQAAAGADAHEAKLAPGPLTALEGYIQIAKPLG
ncbi:hypothetical protein Trisim1_000809 [Trichoderma cf. simile WF8]